MVSPIATSAVGVFPSTQWCRYQAYARATCTVWWCILSGGGRCILVCGGGGCCYGVLVLGKCTGVSQRKYYLAKNETQNSSKESGHLFATLWNTSNQHAHIFQLALANDGILKSQVANHLIGIMVVEVGVCLLCFSVIFGYNTFPLEGGYMSHLRT